MEVTTSDAQNSHGRHVIITYTRRRTRKFWRYCHI